MKSFTTMMENEPDNVNEDPNGEDPDLDCVVIKQINELKKKIDQLNSEAKQHEEVKTRLQEEIDTLKEQLSESFVNRNREEKVEKADEEDAYERKESSRSNTKNDSVEDGEKVN